MRLVALSLAAVVSGLGICGCSGDASTSNEGSISQQITQDITAARDRGPTSGYPADPGAEKPLPPPVEPQPPQAVALPRSLPTRVPQPVVSGDPRAGYEFALATCTPCHVVSRSQKSPLRFANAPEFRAVANASGTTAFGLNIWLTNPHPTMPQLVLSPQEAADVIAFILSLRGKG